MRRSCRSAPSSTTVRRRTARTIGQRHPTGCRDTVHVLVPLLFARENRIVDGRYFGNSLDIPGDCSDACSDHRALVGQYRLRVRVD